MENLTADKLAKITPLQSKLQSLGQRIKSITEQGRLVANDTSQLFLFKGMYKELKPYFDSFNNTWDHIIELMAAWEVTDAFPSQTDKSLRHLVERYYYECCAIYEHHMNPTPPGINASSTSALNDSRSVRARLPQINLPSFDGNQGDWPLFRDTYRSLIHDESSISDIEKFIFLISCLKGPALTLIKGVELQEANYAQAWKLLNDHYNDKRRLASGYLKTLLEYNPFQSRPSARNLKHLLSTVGESIDSFKQLNIPNADNFILFFLLLRCLDSETRKAFEKQHSNIEFPTHQDLIKFLKVEWRSLELTSEDTYHKNSRSINYPNSTPQQRPSNKGFQTSLLVNKQRANYVPRNKSRSQNSDLESSPCPVCKCYHALYQCERFCKASPEERLALLKGWTGCTNCLSDKHMKNTCTSYRRCRICVRDHHTWLHTQQQQEEICASASPAPANTSGVVLGSQCQQGEVLLGTAVIEIQDVNGVYQKVRAVTDSGSQHTFVTERCANKLGLKVELSTQNISGIGQSPLPGVKGKLSCRLRSRLAPDSASYYCTEAIVVARITGNLPHSPVPIATRNIYKSYVLADEEFWKPNTVEFLLGADLYYDIITGCPITISQDVPRLIPTIFGFIIGGPSKRSSIPEGTSSLIAQSTEEMQEVMSKFWALEEVPKRPVISEDEMACENHFLSTHHRLASGRYVVSLPLKKSVDTLTNTKQQALNRFRNLESKLEKDPLLKIEYHDFMREYLSLGHMKLAPAGTSAYTIPHHAVLKTQNGSRKLRVVFDASCPTKSGSLNDHMHAGPKLQLDIGDVISNFRIHQYVFTADIVKMYRQILLNQADRKFQHIFWRFSPKENIQEYELCTVTYGEKASAFLAQRTIKQLVIDEGVSYPFGAAALSQDTYVDDIATGAQTIAQLKQLKEELVALLSKAGFQLSKWSTNCQELIDTLNECDVNDSHISLSDDEDSRIKLLGIQWDPKNDVFSYEIHTPPRNPTKRAILSAIARVYDPLGYLAPVIFYAKTILQEMWKLKMDWDDIGPTKICNKWNKLLDQLQLLSNVKISRLFARGIPESYTIVGFCDASERGYSAVLYLRAVTSNGCEVSLLKAKTKLAPIKLMTIPRLELSGAMLLCRLFQTCKALMAKLNINSAKFFTDSQVVLGWLSLPPEKLNAFVAHRVVEILDLTERGQWSHVRSEENPADCSSRGILPSELVDHPLWWAGPPWLSEKLDNWPHFVTGDSESLPETKQGCSTTLTVTARSNFVTWMERFSCYPKLVRSTAYALRFVDRLRHRATSYGAISVSEYNRAAKLVLKFTQEQFLKDHGKIPNNNVIRSLMPFIDGEDFVRVGGRLQNSELSYDAKHPYLIPASCHLAKLLVDYYHVIHMHLGPTSLQNILQQKYWIVGARGLIRRRIFHCLTCYKAARSPQVPVMGNLPSCRLEEGQVFAHVGVDFGGPFYIKESQRRKASLGKAYLCLFVCMSTKAVHLEVVSKCSTDAFLAAFQRFVARRGKPVHMHSDCGTNFVGAANRLRDLMLLLRSSEAQEKIVEYSVPQGIQWSFNPPSAPHFGGLWEAGIKSSKNILYKVIGETPLTFEEMATLFCRIEGVLNSRPLAPQGSDPTSLDCLTPGHFLIGRPLIAIPEEQLQDKEGILQRWKMIQQKAQHFWRRWQMEYLNLLQQRKKWTKDRANLKIGDLVIVKEPGSPLNSWPLARVSEIHFGKDGIVRVATIRTSTGLYKRPVAKLVALTPINETDSDKI